MRGADTNAVMEPDAHQRILLITQVHRRPLPDHLGRYRPGVGVDAAIGSTHGDAGQAARSPVGEDGISTAPGDTQGFRVALDAGPATGDRGNARPNFPAEGYLPWLRRRIRCANYLTVPKIWHAS
jgi:hypothetical protein